jgi:hypothetical protein
MSAEFLKALTANRLSEGDVVFWAKGQWVEQVGDEICLILPDTHA